MSAVVWQRSENRAERESAHTSTLERVPWFITARGSTCLRASTYLFIVASSLGVVAALLRGGAGHLPPVEGAISIELLPAAAARIAEANLRVVAWSLLGALLFALPTALVSVFNAFRLGSDLCTLAWVSPADAALLLLYVPLEYGGFVHAAAAALQIASRMFCPLFGLPLTTGPPRWLSLTIRACGLVFAGAAVEAFALYLRSVR